MRWKLLPLSISFKFSHVRFLDLSPFSNDRVASDAEKKNTGVDEEGEIEDNKHLCPVHREDKVNDNVCCIGWTWYIILHRFQYDLCFQAEDTHAKIKATKEKGRPRSHSLPFTAFTVPPGKEAKSQVWWNFSVFKSSLKVWSLSQFLEPKTLSPLSLPAC